MLLAGWDGLGVDVGAVVDMETSVESKKGAKTVGVM